MELLTDQFFGVLDCINISSAFTHTHTHTHTLNRMQVLQSFRLQLPLKQHLKVICTKQLLYFRNGAEIRSDEAFSFEVKFFEVKH